VQRALRILSRVLIGAGVLLGVWAIVVWRWQDPFTALYTHWEQQKLGHALSREFADFRPARSTRGLALAARRDAIAADAARFRRTTRAGQPIGRIVIGRIGLNMVLVDGTDESSLEKGPGRDLRSYMPGQGRLVYIAGHRTTYLAPFSHIDAIRPGDTIRIEMPYATFVYRMTRHRVVPANDLSVLRSPRHELLELQACHPRFFATHRYIVYAKLAAMTPRG
jgi:sortase A